jgi:hypothetical protein
MTLVRCPECGGEVSNQATACPHCGAPIAAVLSDNVDTRTDASHARHRADRVGEPVRPTRTGGGFLRGLVILVVLLGLILVGLVVSGIVTF